MSDANCFGSFFFIFRRPTEWALRQAKFNVVSNYLVVGILEEFEDFLLTLENLLPQFFRGALSTWKTPG